MTKQPPIQTDKTSVNHQKEELKPKPLRDSSKVPAKHKKSISRCEPSTNCCWEWAKTALPILTWLPSYKWKTDTVPDLLAGITLALFHMPQSLAFAVIANAPPITGLYTACFTSFVYTLVGTVRLSSFGSMAVASLLTGEAVSNYMTSHNMSIAPDGSEADHTIRMSVISTLTFTTGFIYLVFLILQLTAISVLFSEAFVSGFISSCFVHMIPRVLAIIFKVRGGDHRGFLAVFMNSKEIFLKLPELHVPTTLYSVAVISIFIFNAFVLKIQLAKVMKFVVPIEVIVVAFSITLSYLCDWKSLGYDLIGHVPTGFPEFSPPDPKLIFEVLPDAMITASVIFALSLSTILALTPDFNKPNRETFAWALTNMVCCNFQCMVFGNSIVRALLAINSGFRTQLAAVFASAIIFSLLAFAGPLLEPLPKAVLGCIMFYAICQLIIRSVTQTIALFKKSVKEGIVWLCIFTTTTLFGIIVGLIVGLVLTLRQLLIKVASQEEEKAKEAKYLNMTSQNAPEKESLLEQNSKV